MATLELISEVPLRLCCIDIGCSVREGCVTFDCTTVTIEVFEGVTNKTMTKRGHK
jgi:hypothetical protein